MLSGQFLSCSFLRLVGKPGEPGVPISAMSPVPIVCRISDSLSVEMNKQIAEQETSNSRHIKQVANWIHFRNHWKRHCSWSERSHGPENWKKRRDRRRFQSWQPSSVVYWYKQSESGIWCRQIQRRIQVGVEISQQIHIILQVRNKRMQSPGKQRWRRIWR